MLKWFLQNSPEIEFIVDCTLVIVNLLMHVFILNWVCKASWALDMFWVLTIVLTCIHQGG